MDVGAPSGRAHAALADEYERRRAETIQKIVASYHAATQAAYEQMAAWDAEFKP